MALFKRCWRLSIQIDDVVKTYQELANDETSLKIDFNVDSSFNGTFSNGEITITGLTQRDIAFLSTNYELGSGKLKSSFVTLEVGYQDNISLILNGNIFEAVPDFTSPDNSIRLKVMSGIENNVNLANATLSLENATFKDLCQAVAKNNNVSLDFDDSVENKVVGDYSFQGSPFQQIQELRNLNQDIYVTLSNNSLKVTSINTSKAVKIKIDNKSGLIGSPIPSATGCEVTCLLNPSITINDFISIESLKIPQLNSDYRIMAIKHIGGNRSDNWITILTLQKAKYGI